MFSSVCIHNLFCQQKWKRKQHILRAIFYFIEGRDKYFSKTTYLQMQATATKSEELPEDTGLV